MAPSFDNLTEDNGTYDSEEEIDFSGLSDQTRILDLNILKLRT